MHKYSWAVAKPTDSRKEKNRYYNESSLSFCLISGYFRFAKVILSPLDLVIFYSPETREANITRLKTEYHCEAISLATGE